MKHIPMIAAAMAAALILGGCEYLSAAVGAKRALNDAKVDAWFVGACDLNVGGVMRRSKDDRNIVFAACPPMGRRKLDAAD